MYADGISKINNWEEEFVVQPNVSEAIIAFPNMKNLKKKQRDRTKRCS